MLNYHLQPNVRKPELDMPQSESSPPPDLDSNSTISAAMSLIVAGLSRTSNTSAMTQAKQLVNQHNESNPNNPLPPLNIATIDSRHSFDYVTISLSTDLTSEPRPDILTDVKKFFQTHPGTIVTWSAGSGPDQSRRIFYKADNAEKLLDLEHGVKACLDNKRVAYQGVWTNRQLHRLYFDIVHPEAITWLLDHPIIVSGQNFVPHRPRFITPLYGGECVVFGFHTNDTIQGIQPAINRYLRDTYGANCIAHSRMELDGDVFCVVFTDWSIASRFLNDPFRAFENDPIVGETVTISKPILLYTYNTRGCPTNPAFLQPSCSQNPALSFETRDPSAQLDDTGTKARPAMTSVLTALTNHFVAAKFNMDPDIDNVGREAPVISIVEASQGLRRKITTSPTPEEYQDVSDTTTSHADLYKAYHT